MSIDENGYLGNEITKFCNQILKENKKYFDFCSSLNQLAHRTKNDVKVYNQSDQQLIAACLFMRILEGYQATIILLQYGLQVDAQVTLRSVLEALYILRIISSKPEFIKQYIKAGELARLKTLKKMLKSNNPDFQAFKDLATDEYVKKMGIELEKINNLAEEAGLLYWHESTYTLLSDAVHTNPKLLEKYLDVDDTGEVKKLLWGPDTGRHFRLLILTAGEILIYALDSMNVLFSPNLEMDLKRYHALLGTLLESIDGEVKL